MLGYQRKGRIFRADLYEGINDRKDFHFKPSPTLIKNKDQIDRVPTPKQSDPIRDKLRQNLENPHVLINSKSGGVVEIKKLDIPPIKDPSIEKKSDKKIDGKNFWVE